MKLFKGEREYRRERRTNAATWSPDESSSRRDTSMDLVV